MKNSVKITIVLGVVTSFFPVHPMAPSCYFVEINELKQTNPLLHMKNLHIIEEYNNRLVSVPTTYKNGLPEVLNARTKIRNDDPLYTDRGLALGLTAFRVLKELDRVKNKETLKTICDAVSEGTPVTSKCVILSHRFKNSVSILPDENLISIFGSIEYLFGCPPLCTNSDDRKVDKKRLWMNAIFQGEDNRKERLAYIRGELTIDIHDKFAIEVPEDVTSVILSFLPESNVDEERTRLIKQAEQKFHEELQSQLSLDKEQHSQLDLDETSTYFKRIIKNTINYASKNPRQTELISVFISTLFYFLINLRR